MKCKLCHFGRFQSARLPYLMKLDDQFLVAANISAYRCDTCGYVIFSKSFLERLQYILEKSTQDELSSEAEQRLALSEYLINWQTTGRNS